MPQQPLLKIPLPAPSLLKLRELVRGVHPETFLELRKYNESHVAAANGDLKKIAELLSKNSRIDHAAEDVDTQQLYRPLDLAVKLKKIKVINLLLNLHSIEKVEIKKLNDPLLQGSLAFWEGLDLFLQPQNKFTSTNKEKRGFFDKIHPFEIALKKNPNYMWTMVVNFEMGRNVQALDPEKFAAFLNYIQRHLNLKPKEIQDHLNAVSEKDAAVTHAMLSKHSQRFEMSRGRKP